MFTNTNLKMFVTLVHVSYHNVHALHILYHLPNKNLKMCYVGRLDWFANMHPDAEICAGLFV